MREILLKGASIWQVMDSLLILALMFVSVFVFLVTVTVTVMTLISKRFHKQ